MVQGSFKSSSGKGKGGQPPPKSRSESLKKPAKANAGVGRTGGKPGMKKGKYNVPPKNADALKSYKHHMSLTKTIHKELIAKTAAKAIQHQEKLECQDIRGTGKNLVKEIRREALTRKKTRVEEKLLAAREKMDRLEMNVDK